MEEEKISEENFKEDEENENISQQKLLDKPKHKSQHQTYQTWKYIIIPK